MKVTATLTVLMTLCAWCSILQKPVEAAEWKAGLAKTKITPTTPMPMAGYASRKQNPATGTLDDLWAKVLVIQDPDGKQAALVTLDLCGITPDLTDPIYENVKKQHNWDRSQINFCVSHTHSGPVVGRYLYSMQLYAFTPENQKLVIDYTNWLEQTIVKTVNAAVEDLRPATLQWGNGQASFAVNRRNNREADILKLREEGKVVGPHDHDVPVLLVRRNNKIDGIVFGYACHNTTLGLMTWSADYAGYAQINLEEAYPGCQAMFYSGCGADQNPLPRRTVELAQDYGRQLAVAVQTVVDKGGLHPVKGELSTASRLVPIPLASVPSQEELELRTKNANQYIVWTSEILLNQIKSGKPISPTYSYPVTVWRLGDEITWVFLGGEVVVDYAVRIKSELGHNSDPTQIWCAAYSNDVMAYIPSKRVLLEGGYEGGGSMVYYALPSPWGEKVEEVIVNAVHELSAAKP